MTLDPQARLESALRTTDAQGVAHALAHGADPNERNADGLPPLGTALLSSWSTKVLNGYRGSAEARARLEHRFHLQRHAILHLLLAAGASPEATWPCPHRHKQPIPQDPASSSALLDEVAAYQRQPSPTVEESMARMKPWILAARDWSSLDERDDTHPGSVLDNVDRWLSSSRTDAPVDPRVREFVAAFIMAVAEHSAPMVHRWLTDEAWATREGHAYLPHLLPEQNFLALVTEGLHRRTHASISQLSDRLTSPVSAQVLLEHAILAGYEDGVRQALAAGADPNWANAEGLTPLGLTSQPDEAGDYFGGLTPGLLQGRHRIRQALVQGGAEVTRPWAEHPGKEPYLRLVPTIYKEENELFFQQGYGGISAQDSLARVREWLADDPVQSWIFGHRDEGWSFLDDIEWRLYNIAQEPNQDDPAPAYHTYVSELVVALADTHPEVHARLQRACEDRPDSGFDHLALTAPLPALLARGAAVRVARERLRDLQARPVAVGRTRRQRA